MQILNPKQTKKEIQSFYETAELTLPENPQWRHFRFRTFNPRGRIRWQKIADRVNTIGKLRKHLIEYHPIDAYTTISCWLNPLIGKKTKGIANNLFLFSDFLVDVDDFNKDTIKRNWDILNKEFNGKNSKKLKLNFSGRGWQIIIPEFYHTDIESPIEREKDCLRKMKELTLKLINMGVKFDYRLVNGNLISPSYDTRRICRIPKTIHHSGYLADTVKIKKIQDFIPEKVIDMQYTTKTYKVDNFMEEVKRIASTHSN